MFGIANNNSVKSKQEHRKFPAYLLIISLLVLLCVGGVGRLEPLVLLLVRAQRPVTVRLPRLSLRLQGTKHGL